MPDVPALSLNEDERQVAGRLLTAFFDDYERSIPQRPIFPPSTARLSPVC